LLNEDIDFVGAGQGNALPADSNISHSCPDSATPLIVVMRPNHGLYSKMSGITHEHFLKASGIKTDRAKI
jgi:hypothetical protein